MVVFDTSFLALAFDGKAAIPIDPATNLPIAQCKERIDLLIKSLNDSKKRILIPTPVLAEYLVRAGEDKNLRLNEFTTSKTFVVAAFDIRAAIECAMIEDGDSRSGKKTGEPRTKVKFDRQILAVAISRKAAVIYTGDIGLASVARNNKLHVVMTWEVPLPPMNEQLPLHD